MDLASPDYRAFLGRIFRGHGAKAAASGLRRFDHFLESQIIWDETMAHSVVEALAAHPGARMVVLAGNGHLQYGWGIPRRVRRLSEIRTAVILNGPVEEVEPDLADYLLFVSPIPAPKSPRLGVRLREGPSAVEVVGVQKGSPAARAGIQRGDRILALDGVPVRDTADIKIRLLDAAPGRLLRLRVARPALLRRRTLLLEVRL